jgi:hypothetical protein
MVHLVSDAQNEGKKPVDRLRKPMAICTLFQQLRNRKEQQLK